jgi:hypothetical protein
LFCTFLFTVFGADLVHRYTDGDGKPVDDDNEGGNGGGGVGTGIHVPELRHYRGTLISNDDVDNDDDDVDDEGDGRNWDADVQFHVMVGGSDGVVDGDALANGKDDGIDYFHGLMLVQGKASADGGGDGVGGGDGDGEFLLEIDHVRNHNEALLHNVRTRISEGAAAAAATATAGRGRHHLVARRHTDIPAFSKQAAAASPLARQAQEAMRKRVEKSDASSSSSSAFSSSDAPSSDTVSGADVGENVFGHRRILQKNAKVAPWTGCYPDFAAGMQVVAGFLVNAQFWKGELMGNSSRQKVNRIIQKVVSDTNIIFGAQMHLELGIETVEVVTTPTRADWNADCR